MTDRPPFSRTLPPTSDRDWADLALDVVADVVSVVEDGVVRWVSPSVVRLMGWTPDEVVGSTLADFVHPDDAALGPSDLPGRPDELRVGARVRLRHRDGSYRWVESLLVGRAGPDGRQGHVVMSTRDVSEQVRLEAEARSAEARLRAALDASPDGFAVQRARRGDDGSVEDFVLVLMNHVGAALYGTAPESLAGRGLAELLPGTARARITGLMHRAMGAPGTHRVRVVVDEGPVHEVIDVAAVRVDDDHVLTTWRDVTEQVLAEGVLIEAYGRAQAAWDTLHATLDALPDAVLLVDVEPRDGGPAVAAVAHANRAAADRLGLDRDAAIGRLLEDVLPAACPTALSKLVRDTAADGARRSAREQVTNADGRPLVMEVLLAPVGRGQVVVTCRDVTRRENDLQRLEQGRRHAEHDAAHDRVTGLPNRDGLEQRLRRALMSCPPDRGVGVLVCDVRIEDVNVEHGLRVGDDVLCTLAERLAAAAGPDGTAARLGAGTFVLVVPDTATGPHAGTAPHGDDVVAALRGRVAQAVAEPVATAAGPVGVTARLAHHVARPAARSTDREPVEVLDAAMRRIAASPPL